MDADSPRNLRPQFTPSPRNSNGFQLSDEGLSLLSCPLSASTVPGCEARFERSRRISNPPVPRSVGRPSTSSLGPSFLALLHRNLNLVVGQHSAQARVADVSHLPARQRMQFE